MQIEIKAYNNKGNGKFPQRIVQGGSPRKLQTRNKPNEGNTQKNQLFFNITAQPLICNPIDEDLSETEFRHLASLMVKATRSFTGSLKDWNFSTNNCLQDLIIRCASRLKDRADIDNIEVLYESDNTFRLGLKRYVTNRDKVYVIFLKPVFELRKRNRLLGNILLSFIKSLPFNSLFDYDEIMIEWIWTYLYDGLQYCKEEDTKEEYKERLRGSVTFYSRYYRSYTKTRANRWKTLLEYYNPVKKEYQQIKELLLSSERINFHSPSQLTTYSNEVDIEHSDTFLIADDEGSDFISTYIDMLNQMGMENDVTSAFTFGIVDDDIVEPFNENIAYDVASVENFITELNEILEKI